MTIIDLNDVNFNVDNNEVWGSEFVCTKCEKNNEQYGYPCREEIIECHHCDEPLTFEWLD